MGINQFLYNRNRKKTNLLYRQPSLINVLRFRLLCIREFLTDSLETRLHGSVIKIIYITYRKRFFVIDHFNVEQIFNWVFEICLTSLTHSRSRKTNFNLSHSLYDEKFQLTHIKVYILLEFVQYIKSYTVIRFTWHTDECYHWFLSTSCSNHSFLKMCGQM